MFQKQKSATVLFSKDSSQDLRNELSEASTVYEGDLLFVEITVKKA